MSNRNVIRAWKDPAYRNSLSEAERSAMPANPAGAIEISDADLGKVAGGNIPTTLTHVGCTFFCTNDCPTFFCTREIFLSDLGFLLGRHHRTETRTGFHIRAASPISPAINGRSTTHFPEKKTMSNRNVIRAWKDPVYRNSLSQAERSAIPANPAGAIEISDEDLGKVSGGGVIPWPIPGPNPPNTLFCTWNCVTYGCHR